MAWHYLRPNASTGQPGQIVVLDTETRPRPNGGSKKSRLHVFRLGHAIGWRLEKGQVTRMKEIAFCRKQEFWDWIEMQTAERRPLWVFAHNLPFDLTVLGFWEKLSAKEFTVLEPQDHFHERIGASAEHWIAEHDHRKAKGKAKAHKISRCVRGKGFMCLQDPPTILSLFNKAGRKVIFVDTLNWFRCSLAELGDLHGVPKLPRPDFAEPDSVWRVYCRNDAAILAATVQVLMAWVKKEELGMFRWTISAQAMAAYRHKFMKRPILFHDQPETRKLERAGYYGGRAYVFKHGLAEGPIHVVDVNSLYPSQMQAGSFPCKLLSHEVYHAPLGPHAVQLGINQCARVMVHTGRSLPVRLPGVGVRYLAGRFSTVLAGPELDDCVRRGEITSVSERSTYELAYLFREWVDHFWQKRKAAEKEGNLIYANLYKLMLNSLYGKFGQWSPQWEDEPGHRWIKEWGTYEERVEGEESPRIYRSVGWHNQRRQADREKPDAFPAISAWVTSYGRLQMDFYRSVAGHRHVYYQGVDSLHLDDEGLWNLAAQGWLEEDALGALKSVGTYSQGEYRGPNDYTLDGKHTTAGRKATAAELPEGGWEQTNFEGLRGIIADGPREGILEYTEAFTPSKRFDHGKIGLDGWVDPFLWNSSNAPLTLEELEAKS